MSYSLAKPNMVINYLMVNGFTSSAGSKNVYIQQLDTTRVTARILYSHWAPPESRLTWGKLTKQQTKELIDGFEAAVRANMALELGTAKDHWLSKHCLSKRWRSITDEQRKQ